MSPMFRSSLVAAAALFFLQLSSVQAANVLFVSDSTTDANLPGVLSADGHNVTVVNSDYSGGANATLTASLSSYDLVVWSATGGGYGGSHNAATITALESFVSGGGKVFLTGYDSLASPTDSNLIGFVGGGTVSDGGSPASAVVNQVNSLSVGVVDIRGVTPSGGYSDQDTVRNLQSGVVGVVASSSSNGYVWVLRSLGNGEIAYVSNGAHRSTSVTPSWTNTASGGAGAYNAAVRNFASSVTDNDGDGATLSEDCDDNDPNNFPGNPEVCDGADNDCDATTFAVGGESDADADGSIACLDCDDNDPNNYPGNTELCDGADNDCDGSLLGGVASAPQSLTTTFAAGNGSQGNIFDVVVQNDVQVTGFDAHVTSSGSGTMDVWWKLGTGYNSTSSNTDWTFHETVSIAGVGSTGTPTPVPLSTPISLSGGQTYSIYMLSSNGIRYTSGSTLGAVVAQDGNIEVTEGYGCGSAFTCTFNPRIWNGTIHYFESGSLEADDDGDGYVDCTWVGSDPAIVGGDDCDDGNTTAWPGSTELCDGIDNDCDGTPDFIGPGYYGVADSGSGGPAFNFVDIEATGTSLSLGDDQVSPAVAIGFSFDFYGVPYSQAYVSSNGFVTFDANSNSGCCSGQSLPSTTAPNNLIAMLWEDLRPPSGGSIHYETQGTSPNGLFIVQFTDIEHYFSGNPSTMQLQLHEDGRIEIHYLSVQSDGGNHTIGIENGDGTLASTYVNRADPGAITNLAVGFPTPAGSTEVDSDGDSSLACADCDDNEASVFPGNPEVCDGLDNDCDATTEASGGEGDGDGDGAVACADCDDAVATNFPGNTEACDGLDND